MRTLLIAVAFLFTLDAYACPMADAAAYAAAAQEVKAAAGTHVTLKIDGLTCGSCSETVTAALKGVTGVKAAAVDYQTGEALVAFDAGQTNVDALLSTIQQAGYTAKKADAKS